MPRRLQGFEPRARGSRKAPPQPAHQHLWGLIATLLHFGHGTQQPQLLDVADPSWGLQMPIPAGSLAACHAAAPRPPGLAPRHGALTSWYRLIIRMWEARMPPATRSLLWPGWYVRLSQAAHSRLEANPSDSWSLHKPRGSLRLLQASSPG